MNVFFTMLSGFPSFHGENCCHSGAERVPCAEVSAFLTDEIVGTSGNTGCVHRVVVGVQPHGPGLKPYAYKFDDSQRSPRESGSSAQKAIP